jgi:hypothetical protein
MPQIHLIDGEKGGVGKSFFARALVYYLNLKKLSFHLVDSDRSNPDVASRYPERSQTVFFSEVEKKANDVDVIFNLSLEMPVIVNYPVKSKSLSATGLSAMDSLMTWGKNMGLEVYKWFLCTGAHDSNTLFIESAQKFKGRVKHVLIKNQAFSDEDDWKQIFQDYPQLEQLLKNRTFPNCTAKAWYF